MCERLPGAWGPGADLCPGVPHRKGLIMTAGVQQGSGDLT